jgi:hypothetical protein
MRSRDQQLVRPLPFQLMNAPTWQAKNTFVTRPFVAHPSLHPSLSASTETPVYNKGNGNVTSQWTKGVPSLMVLTCNILILILTLLFLHLLIFIADYLVILDCCALG